MKKNNLKKVFALGLSTTLVSMSCLNASAIDYKKVLNKKNISIAALGSAVILGSYFLYNHFKAPSTEKSQDEGQLDKISDHQVGKGKGSITEEEQKPTEKKAKDQQNEEEFEVFDASDTNCWGRKKGQDTKPILMKRITEISKDEKSDIVKRRNEKIKSISVSKKGREKGNPLLIFSNGRKIEGKDLNLNDNFRQDKDSGMIYFKLDGKLYELGEYMLLKKVKSDGKIYRDRFFACADKKIWDFNGLSWIEDDYNSELTSIICNKDSWRALLFVGYIYI